MHTAPAAQGHPARARARPWLAVWVSAVHLAAALLLLLPTASPAQPITVQDDRGRSITLARPPERIVSLLPALTEIVCVLQACKRLAGVDRYSTLPASMPVLPRLGGIDDLPVEALLRLKPDLVLVARSHRAVDRLQALGLNVLALEPQTHADVQRTLMTVATLLGRPDQGAAAWQTLQQQITKAAGQVPAAWRGQRVYFEVASTPFAASSGSFIGETLLALGLGNVVPADMGPFPQLNPEFVLRAQPAVVMASAREAAALPARPGWQRLDAVRHGRVCSFDTTAWNQLVRPGPGLGDGAAAIARCLASLSPPSP